MGTSKVANREKDGVQGGGREVTEDWGEGPTKVGFADKEKGRRL